LFNVDSSKIHALAFHVPPGGRVESKYILVFPPRFTAKNNFILAQTENCVKHAFIYVVQ